MTKQRPPVETFMIGLTNQLLLYFFKLGNIEMTLITYNYINSTEPHNWLLLHVTTNVILVALKKCSSTRVKSAESLNKTGYP